MTVTHVLSRDPKTPTQERGERRVAELLRAAEQVFAAKGYESTKMSAIAELAGASIGSLYQFFPSKESIGGALIRGYMNELNDQLDSWKADLPHTLREFGPELIQRVLDYTTQRPACRVLTETPSPLPKSHGIENLAQSVQLLLATYAPSMAESELSAVALTSSFMVRLAIHGSRTVDSKKGSELRGEIQRALGCYLEDRLGVRSSAVAAASEKRC